MDLHQSVLIFFTEQIVVVGVECKSHNSSFSKMSRAELERWSRAELVKLITECIKLITVVAHLLSSQPLLYSNLPSQISRQGRIEMSILVDIGSAIF